MSNVDVQRIQLSSCNTVACMMRYVFNGMFWVFFKWEKKIGWLFLARSSKRHIGLFKCFFLHSRSERLRSFPRLTCYFHSEHFRKMASFGNLKNALTKLFDVVSQLRERDSNSNLVVSANLKIRARFRVCHSNSVWNMDFVVVTEGIQERAVSGKVLYGSRELSESVSPNY